jgi:hypothetical protein
LNNSELKKPDTNPVVQKQQKKTHKKSLECSKNHAALQKGLDEASDFDLHYVSDADEREVFSELGLTQFNPLFD